MSSVFVEICKIFFRIFLNRELSSNPTEGAFDGRRLFLRKPLKSEIKIFTRSKGFFVFPQLTKSVKKRIISIHQNIYIVNLLIILYTELTKEEEERFEI